MSSDEFNYDEYEIQKPSWKEFRLNSKGDLEVTDELKQEFDKWGFVIVRKFLPGSQLNKIRNLMETSKEIRETLVGGLSVPMCLWNNVDDGYPGLITSCRKMVEPWEAFLNDEVYHYHTKLVLKEANDGGAASFSWHQDYGYWYWNGNLTADMGTTWIAIDKATRHNGGLKIVPESHNCGRIHHDFPGVEKGGQAVADEARLRAIIKRFGWVNVEIDEGDAIFFHSNVLHMSQGNTHPTMRRWCFIASYNTKTNSSIIKHHHPQYVKLNKVENSLLDGEAKFPTNCDYLGANPHKEGKPNQDNPNIRLH